MVWKEVNTDTKIIERFWGKEKNQSQKKKSRWYFTTKDIINVYEIIPQQKNKTTKNEKQQAQWAKYQS